MQHDSGMSTTFIKNTYATFDDPHMAEKAAGALLDHGMKAEHISIVFPEGYGQDARDETKNEEKSEQMAKSGITTTTVGDAAAGSAKGAGVGLAAGALAALAAVFLPGVGLVLGGGALAIAAGGVAGATAAGAVAGGVAGFLKDQGVPDDSIEVYNRVLKSGGAMITVSPTDENITTVTIEAVLAKYGGSTSSYPFRASGNALIHDEMPGDSKVIR
jgi:hypothetical protein